MFSPGRFGIYGRYPLRMEGIPADTPCECKVLDRAQLINPRHLMVLTKVPIKSAQGKLQIEGRNCA